MRWVFSGVSALRFHLIVMSTTEGEAGAVAAVMTMATVAPGIRRRVSA